jgi:uncharacterized membrane protein YuzA (DUF378 family)
MKTILKNLFYHFAPLLLSAIVGLAGIYVITFAFALFIEMIKP